MIAYSRDASFSEAVSMTFDGEHPCKLCKAVKKGRQAEQEKAASTVSVSGPQKFDFLLAEGCLVVFPLRILDSESVAQAVRPVRSDPPLLRPPILA